MDFGNARIDRIVLFRKLILDARRSLSVIAVVFSKSETSKSNVRLNLRNIVRIIVNFWISGMLVLQLKF